MKRALPIVLILISSLACSFFPFLSNFSPEPTVELEIRIETAIAQTQAAQPTQPAPTAAPLPTDTPLPPPTQTPSPEEINTGEHRYWTEVEERGCSASDPELYPRYRVKEMAFSPDFSTAVYAEREYARVGEHRYQSVNQDGKPLVLEFRSDGFSLLIFETGTDPALVPACLIYTFNLDDE